MPRKQKSPFYKKMRGRRKSSVKRTSPKKSGYGLPLLKNGFLVIVLLLSSSIASSFLGTNSGRNNLKSMRRNRNAFSRFRTPTQKKRILNNLNNSHKLTNLEGVELYVACTGNSTPSKFVNLWELFKLTNLEGVELYVACTGNTCRSPSIELGGLIHGYNIKTCGTNVRGISGITPALLKSIESSFSAGNISLNVLQHAKKHRSQQCQLDDGNMFKNSPNKVFLVVANSNKEHLLKMAREQKVPRPTVFTLSEAVNIAKQRGIPVSESTESACSYLQNDPWDYTPEAFEEEGRQFTSKNILKMHEVYDE